MSFQPSTTSAEQTPKRPHLSTISLSSMRRTPSNEPPAYSPHDVLADRYQRFAGYLHWARVATAFITLVAGVTITACTASAFRSYSSTQLDSQFMLPLWPSTVDLRPSQATLACGILITIFSLVYLFAAFLPTPGVKLRLLNILSTPLSFFSLFMAVFTTAYASSISSHLAASTDAGTLTSWTCKWNGFEASAPKYFGQICNESNVSLDIVNLLIVIEFFAVVMAGWGWWVEARVRREDSDKGCAIGA